MSSLRNTLSKLTLAFWMLPIRAFCVCVYFSLRPGSSRVGIRSMTLRLWPSERMLRISSTKGRTWCVTVVSLPKSIPPGTFWREPVIVWRYSTVERSAEIELTLYTRFSRVAVGHGHWLCSIRRDPSQSNSLVLPKLSSQHYQMTGSPSGSASTDYVVLTNDAQSVYLRSSPEDP